MKTNLAISISHGFSVIGIHLTPKIGLGHKISGFLCKHSTYLTNQFKVLRRVTQLHLGGTCEN